MCKTGLVRDQVSRTAFLADAHLLQDPLKKPCLYGTECCIGVTSFFKILIPALIPSRFGYAPFSQWEKGNKEFYYYIFLIPPLPLGEGGIVLTASGGEG